MRWTALFRAPAGPSSTEIRKLDLRSLAAGVALFVPGLLLFVVARAWLLEMSGTTTDGMTTVRVPRPFAFVIGGPLTAGYCLILLPTA